MTEEQQPKRGWQKYQNIVLAAVAAVIAGLAIGWAFIGGDTAPTNTTTGEAAPPTEPLEPVTTTTTMLSPPSTDVPGQISFVATEDTYVNEGEPQDNNGTADAIEVRTDPPSEVERGLIRFDVSGIPEGETIRSATLRLFVDDDSDNAVNLHLVEGTWSQAETVGANAPAVGEQVATFRATPEASFVEIDVTSVVTEPGQYDFYLVSTGSDSAEFNSTEEGENVPTLIVRWLEGPVEAKQGSLTLAESSNLGQ